MISTTAPILPGCTVLPPMDEPEQPTIEPPKPKPKRKAANRFAVLNGFVDVTMGELSRAEIATWLILYRDVRNGTARTSQTDIARRGGMSTRTVKRAIERLRGRGLLTVVRRGGLRQGPSTYRVHPLGESYKVTLASRCLGDTSDTL